MIELFFGVCLGIGFVIFFPSSFDKVKKKAIHFFKSVSDK